MTGATEHRAGGLTLLLCASAFEAKACCRALAEVPPGRFEVLACGIGPERAARRLVRRLAAADRARPARLVSTGLCGSRWPDLPILTSVVPRSVVTFGQPPLVPDLAVSALVGLHGRAPIVAAHWQSVPSVVANAPLAADAPGERAVVDMETYAWATVAHRMGIPWGGLRVVSDAPQHPMLPAVVSLGQGAWGRGLRQLVAQPAPALAFVQQMRRALAALQGLWSVIGQGEPPRGRKPRD